MSRFQIILLTLCVVFIVAGVTVFSLTKDATKSARGTTVLWGTIPDTQMQVILSQARVTDGLLDVTYVQKKPETFDQEFIEALASGKGPDGIILSQDSIVKYADKIIPIPFTTLPERDFKDTFVTEGDLFLSDTGVLGVPFTVDPLVLYWNRDVFANAGLATPPKLWQDFLTITPKLTVRKGVGDAVITKTAVALGEYRNIENAKAILSALLLQAGTPIVSMKNGRPSSALGFRSEQGFSPAESVLRFYTQFADPQKAMYAWNRSFTSAQQKFLSGDLATYVGFASELATLRVKNPNLNFDVTLLPQTSNDSLKTTFGQMYALALVRGSANPNGTIANFLSLASASVGSVVSETLHLPPVRRDLLSVQPTDPYKAVFNNSALVAKGWLDPSRSTSDQIFKDLVESVSSGRLSLPEAISEANNQLDAVLK
ncbi:MAG: hypothetical protein RLZZ347_55 [Candidatus Parcubacteria bacterium]|jgi:multiple sugar transport system substrate-binding protein